MPVKRKKLEYRILRKIIETVLLVHKTPTPVNTNAK